MATRETNILIAAGIYPPEIGGPATYTKLLEEHLPEKGFKLDVLPFRVVRFLPSVIRHIAYTWKLFRMARKTDVVFVQDTVSTGLPALIAAKLARKPLIIRVPGDYAWEQGRQRFGVEDPLDDFQDKTYGWKVELLRRIQRLVVCSADKVIVPSEYFRRIVSMWGVAPDHLQVIYNGIELDIKAKQPENIPPGHIMVTIGRLVPWKGFDALITMMCHIPDWHLVIIGDGPQRQNLEKRTQENNVMERVTFTGNIPRGEMFGWLQAADVFVLNSSFESFSFQTVEAMLAEVPVIVTNIGSLPELVQNGVEGLVVTPDDTEAIKASLPRILEDNEIRRNMTTVARKKAEQFSIEKTLDQLVQLIKETI